MALKINDMRHREYPVYFKDLPEGSVFCEPTDAESIYIKLRTEEGEHNAVYIPELYATDVLEDSMVIPLSAVIQIYDALPEQEDEG